MPKFPKLPKGSKQEVETFLDEIISSGFGKTKRDLDIIHGFSFPAYRFYDPEEELYEYGYHLKPLAVRKEAMKRIRKKTPFEIREVQIGTPLTPDIHNVIWGYEPDQYEPEEFPWRR